MKQTKIQWCAGPNHLFALSFNKLLATLPKILGYKAKTVEIAGRRQRSCESLSRYFFYIITEKVIAESEVVKEIARYSSDMLKFEP